MHSYRPSHYYLRKNQTNVLMFNVQFDNYDNTITQGFCSFIVFHACS